ncbi:MAG: thermonuclease family protein [Candidatus Sumerlaeota bacterium]
MKRSRAISRSRGYSGRQTGAWKKTVLVLLLLSCGLLTGSGIYYYHSPADAKAVIGKAEVIGQKLVEVKPESFTVGRVTRVISLNEMVIASAGKEQRVRLLNIAGDGKNPGATEKLRLKLENAQVRLEPNVQEGFDSAGRRLGYLLVDGENFNLAMVRDGLSTYDVRDGKSAKYDMEFRMAEADARARKAGIWASK